jgi:3-mercaptopyruvate sulfurtransferase SseA
VYALEGGWDAWLELGYPTEGDRVPVDAASATA